MAHADDISDVFIMLAYQETLLPILQQICEIVIIGDGERQRGNFLHHKFIIQITSQ